MQKLAGEHAKCDALQTAVAIQERKTYVAVATRGQLLCLLALHNHRV